jgi:modulator of FtsH protease HflC
MAQTGRSHVNVLLRRSLPALALAGVVWAIASSLFTIDVTEYGLVTRFGRVVRVVAEPGLYVTVPFDRVVRLDKRVLFSRLPFEHYLAIELGHRGKHVEH